MGVFGIRRNRSRRAVGLVGVIATVAAVLLVGAAPTSADTTGFTVTAVGSPALFEEGTTSVTYTVELTGDPELTPVTISASGGAPDVTLSPTSLALDKDNATGSITVTAVDDNIDEPGQTLNLNFSSSPAVGTQPATVTVADNDSPPTVTGISSVTKLEGNAGSTAYTFTATLSNPSSVPFDLNYQTVPNTALASDFAGGAPPTGTITFAALQTSKDVVVNVQGDTTVEATELPCSTVITPDTGCETFFVNAGGKQAKGTIINDDTPPALPTLSVGNLTVAESAGTAHVTVTLSAASGSTVTVNATTSDGSATAPGDYAAVTVPVTIPAGQTTGDVPIPIASGSVDEPTETFTVTLSSPNNATIADGAATVTITDDDNNSALSVTSATVTEPANGAAAVNATFTVSLLPASDRTVSVPFSVTGVEATAGSDFTASSGTLTFNPGQTSRTITVPVLGDAVYDTGETFRVALGTPSGAKLGTPATGIGTIVDAAAPPALTIADATVSEGDGNAVVTVTLTGNASQSTVTVSYKTTGATGSAGATSGSDFTATTGTLTFPAGTTARTITIPIANDTAAESDESFTVTLETPVNATLAKTTATVKIVDNDTGAFNPPGGGTKPPTTTPTPPATAPKTPPVTTVRLLQGRVLSARMAGKVDGRLRASIRLTLDQSVTAKLTMVQGKRKLSSAGFPIKFGNRIVYVILPNFVKKGKVNFTLNLTTGKGATKTLKTFVVVAKNPTPAP